MSFVTNPFPTNPDFKVDDKVFRCEAASDRWLIEGDDDSYYYHLKNETAKNSIEPSNGPLDSNIQDSKLET